jgi:hypothetical protein
MNDSIKDVYIEKAVDIWCKALHRPAFDNGDDSPNGGLGMLLATGNCATDQAKVDMVAAVEKFRAKLTANLKDERDAESYFSVHLHTDYNPCQELAVAAENTGITENMFSIKSSVACYGSTVETSFGYGAPTTYYYYFGGHWILTKSRLDESERPAILGAILDGRIEGFESEEA